MPLDKSTDASLHLNPWKSYVIAMPSDEEGAVAPCKSKCEHSDCLRWHGIAKKPCRWCGDPIGYDRQYLIENDENSILIHTDCWMEANPSWG